MCAAVRAAARSRMGLKVVGILLEGEKYELATKLLQRPCVHTDRAATKEDRQRVERKG